MLQIPLFDCQESDMRYSIRLAAAATMCVALVAAGPASAHDRYHGGGNGAGVALAVGALVGLAVGAAMVAPAVTYAQPAPVAYAQPAPVAYAPAPVAYARPAAPAGYCYSDYNRAYVPCGPQPGYYPPAPAYGY
jgi:hypothetical protein